jgi:hypothetical protein
MVGAFDDAEKIHHEHAIGKIANHRQIVRNEEINEPELFLKIDQQIENLRLDREKSSADTGSSQTKSLGAGRALLRYLFVAVDRRRMRVDNAARLLRGG